MLVLKNLEGEIYNLFTKPEHIVGRFGNLILLKDTSVSRQHACIKITFQNGRPKILLLDLGSKYGTYVNDGISSSKAIFKGEPVILEVGDKIRFGQQWNIWILEETSYIVCTSKLSLQEQKWLKDVVSRLNGVIVNDWTKNCTHLTMSEISVSVEVVCALGHVKPIVSIEYWKQLIRIISSCAEQSIPDCDNFIPPIVDQQLNLSHACLKMNNVRKTLFQNWKFIAFNRNQYDNVLMMVEAAGGSVYDGNVFKILEKELLNEKIVVLQNNSETINNNVLHISNFLNVHGLRFIQEVEICLSIAECSTEKYCNPVYDISVLLKRPETQVIIKDEATVLANDTENTDITDNIQFRETESGNFSLNVNEFRMFSESEDEDIIQDSCPSMPKNPSSIFRKETNLFSSLKRKLETTKEITTNAKQTKFDSSVINENPVEINASENSIFEFANSNVSSIRKNSKHIFNFRNEMKINETNSSNLFSRLNEQNSTCTTSTSERILERKTRASINGEITEISSPPFGAKAKKLENNASIFAGINERRTSGSTNSLFSSFKNSNRKNGSTLELGKRKRSDDVKIVPCPSTFVNFNPKSIDMFTRPSTSKISQNDYRVIPDSDDESNSSFTNQTSRLTISKESSKFQETPIIDVPANISLSQFVDVAVEKNAHEIEMKQKMSAQDREHNDKFIIHTVPLLKNMQESTPFRNEDSTKVNFKRFRKINHFCQLSNHTVSTSELYLHSGIIKGYLDD